MSSSTPRLNKSFLTIKEICIFSMLGSLMFVSKIIMELLPNIHLLGMLIMVYTLVYRSKALIPIYIYVFLNGLYCGFAAWWIPYLYIWTVLWGITMLLPKKMPYKLKAFVYPLVCALYGLSFGVLYAPAQAIMFNLDFKAMLLWIAAGFFSFDIYHCVGNFLAGLLILPMSILLKKISVQVNL